MWKDIVNNGKIFPTFEGLIRKIFPWQRESLDQK